MIFWGVYFDLHTKVQAMYRYLQILPVFDMFEVKIGGVQQKKLAARESGVLMRT